MTSTGGALHRTQVLLEPWQFDMLKDRARREGTSVAAVIRDLVEASLGGSVKRPGLAKIAGMFSAGGDAIDHDEELYG